MPNVARQLTYIDYGMGAGLVDDVCTQHHRDSQLMKIADPLIPPPSGHPTPLFHQLHAPLEDKCHQMSHNTNPRINSTNSNRQRRENTQRAKRTPRCKYFPLVEGLACRSERIEGLSEREEALVASTSLRRLPRIGPHEFRPRPAPVAPGRHASSTPGRIPRDG